jgi:hypothetical protein
LDVWVYEKTFRVFVKGLSSDDESCQRELEILDRLGHTDPKGLSSDDENRCRRELEILDVLGIRENL